MNKNPIRIILDSLGTIKSDSKIIRTCNRIQTVIAVSESISKKNLSRLLKFPLDVIICGKNIVNVPILFRLLLISINSKDLKLIFNWREFVCQFYSILISACFFSL